jgi:hypothetical protein
MRYVIQMKINKDGEKQWVDVGYYPRYKAPPKNPGPYIPYSYPNKRWASVYCFKKRRNAFRSGYATEYRLRPVKPGEDTEPDWFCDRQIKFLEESTHSFHKTNRDHWNADGTLKLN